MVDGLKGFPEAIGTVFPLTTVQTCEQTEGAKFWLKVMNEDDRIDRVERPVLPFPNPPSRLRC